MSFSLTGALIGAGASAFSNILGQSSSISKQNKYLDQYIKMRKNDMYDKSEMYDRLDNVDDAYNTAAMGVLNNSAFSTALKSSGNQSGIREHMITSSMVDKAKAKLAEQDKMDSVNREISNDIARAQMSRQSFDFGSTLGSAFTGALAGNEMQKSSILMDKLQNEDNMLGGSGISEKAVEQSAPNFGLNFFKKKFGGNSNMIEMG